MNDFARTPKQLGASLRRRRRQLGLSQAALGERAGVRQATISTIESGGQSARLSTLFDVMSALQLEISVHDRRKLSAEDGL
ncbi:MAG: helix-turn-helix domain-containing protein [Parvularculaceae bacterium]|nr:helix-turn-helix domain-containing protein [Parvularculaceae bacterium]